MNRLALYSILIAHLLATAGSPTCAVAAESSLVTSRGCEQTLDGKAAREFSPNFEKPLSSSSFEEGKRLMREHIRAAMGFANQNPYAFQVREIATAEYLKTLAMRTRSVGLFIEEGSPDEQERLMDYVQRRIASAKDRGALVFYDADSWLAPMVQAELGRSAIGITTRPVRDTKNNHNLFQLRNPMLRLIALSAPDAVVSSRGSLIGLALFVNDVYHLRTIVDFSSGEPSHPETSLETWAKSVEAFKMKLASYAAKPKVVSEYSEPDYAGIRVTPQDFGIYTPSFESWLKDQYSFDLEGMIARAASLTAGLRDLPGEWEGAAVFGSSKNYPEFSDISYLSTRRVAERGYAIATGGSSGLMQVANTAAWDAGALSIGIPMSKYDSLKGEKVIPREVQDVTFDARGYMSRIPLILKDRRLIGFLPGGKGTMQELAVTLLYLGLNPAIRPEIYFVSREYYGGLVDVLLHYGPPELANAIHVIDRPEDIDAVIAKTEKARARTRLKLNLVRPKARNVGRTIVPIDERKAPEAPDSEEDKGKDKETDKGNGKDDKGTSHGSSTSVGSSPTSSSSFDPSDYEIWRSFE